MNKLLKLLVSKCGFSQISYEKLWRINHIDEKPFSKHEFRQFKNSDAYAVSSLYNETLLPHFRPILATDAKEYREHLFKGLSYYSEYKYVIEDNSSKNIIAYLAIRTSDNQNYIIDIIQTSWIELDINKIVNFANKEIKKRKNRFNLFIKTKKYTQLGEKYEQFCKENQYLCIQNQVVLTNSSAKIIKNSAKTRRFIVLDQLYSGQIGVN